MCGTALNYNKMNLGSTLTLHQASYSAADGKGAFDSFLVPFTSWPQKHFIHRLLNWWPIHQPAGYCLTQMYLFLTQEEASRVEELNQNQNWRRSQQANPLKLCQKTCVCSLSPISLHSGNIKKKGRRNEKIRYIYLRKYPRSIW